MRDGLGSYAGQSLYFPDDSLAEGKIVGQGGSGLACFSHDLLVTFLLNLLILDKVQDHPQDGGGGRLCSSFEEVEASDFKRL